MPRPYSISSAQRCPSVPQLLSLVAPPPPLPLSPRLAAEIQISLLCSQVWGFFLSWGLVSVSLTNKAAAVKNGELWTACYCF